MKQVISIIIHEEYVERRTRVRQICMNEDVTAGSSCSGRA
jgi:hypothetical protein